MKTYQKNVLSATECHFLLQLPPYARGTNMALSPSLHVPCMQGSHQLSWVPVLELRRWVIQNSPRLLASNGFSTMKSKGRLLSIYSVITSSTGAALRSSFNSLACKGGSDWNNSSTYWWRISPPGSWTVTAVWLILPFSSSLTLPPFAGYRFRLESIARSRACMHVFPWLAWEDQHSIIILD